MALAGCTVTLLVKLEWRRQRNRAHDARRGSARERGYTHHWDRAAAAFKREHPLCAMCEREGRVTPAYAVDHIIPHKGDMARFWDRENWQSLCKPCHDLKTVTEDGGLESGAMTHPEWLPSPACPVTLVTGPPGAGKTTYCREHSTIADIIIDLDDCFTAVCGVHGHIADRKHLKQAIRYRNKLIASLVTKHQGRAFVIVSAPSLSECEWWTNKLNAEHVRINPGLPVCQSRVIGRRRQAAIEWFAKADRNDWKHPGIVRRRVIGQDGWPVVSP